MAEESQQHRNRRWLTSYHATILGFFATSLLCGCQNGPLAALRSYRDDTFSRAPTKTELGDNQGLLGRWLTPKPSPNTDPTAKTPLVKGPRGWEPPKVQENPEADAEFKAAFTLFEQKQYGEAEKAFKAIAKKRKETPWGEKAQFYLAESYYQEGKFVYAHDALDQLVKDYSGTLYMDKVASREYAIGLKWLALSDPKTKPEDRIPWQGRFTGRRPILDTTGYALQVMEHVRQHEPLGPLADDATMTLADVHVKQADYETAAEYYRQFVELYPKSPDLQKAHHAAIDAWIKGYGGPELDGTGLEKAREMIHKTMRAFPDRAENNEKLYHTLALINDQDAERAFKVGEFYRRTGKVASAEYYFGKIPQCWPKSPWATKAKAELATLAKMPRTPSLPSRMFTQPGSSDPFSSNSGASPLGMGGGMNGMGGMGGMGMGGMGGMGMM